jgi:hypothetical protein
MLKYNIIKHEMNQQHEQERGRTKQLNDFSMPCGQLQVLGSNLIENTVDDCGCHFQCYSKH